MSMKLCNKCNINKSLSDFSKDRYSTDGYKSFCKVCCNISHAKWVSDNPDKVLKHANSSYNKRKKVIQARRKELRVLNPKMYREKARETRNKNLEHYQRKGRESSWKRAGIVDMTYVKYESMLIAQNNCCAICNTNHSQLKKKLGVDHNHQTGKARGLLCDSCNRAIGYLKESELLLVSALNYLKQYGKE